MRKCRICGTEINNDRVLCKRCNQDKRNLKYYMKKIDDWLDRIGEIPKP